ncbi:MAG TPA: hypothetical protein VMJ93_00360 [Verrucomicrobiae bacterium]|nr:hypothetical protein [Verrucomicrobiae bacterium]
MRGISRLAFWALVIVMVVLPSCGEGYINNPVPVLTSISPSSEEAQSPQFTLTLTGNNFTPSSALQWDNPATGTQTLLATFLTVHTMTALISPQLIQNPGVVTVSVFTPAPGGGASGTLSFTITPRPSPVPTISSISPTIADAGSSQVSIAITGTGFVTQSVVEVNGANLSTTVNGSTSIEATIPGVDLTAAGPLPIVVLNPPPGGGASNIFNLSLQNPVPRITSITPTGVAAGATDAVLTVAGSGFDLGSVVLANGTPLVTTFGGATTLTAKVPGSMLSAGGILQITVTNPAPGGGVSAIEPLAVNPTATAGLPVIVDLSSNTMYPGAQAISGICGTLENCETTSNGLEPLTTSGPSSSQTGQYVVFASISDNLVDNDASPESQIFLRNTCLGGSASCTPQTTIVSLDPNGNPANGPSAEPTTASGGGQVAFSSLAQNLVTSVAISGKYRQVYWTVPCQVATGCTSVNTELVSISADGTSEGNGDSYDPVISPDGRYVAFVSLATNLASNVLADGVTPQLYLTDTCSGVTTSGCNPTTYLVSTPDGITPGNGASSHPSVASGGQYVTFTSTASNLGPEAPNPSRVPNVFIGQVCFVTETSCTVSTSLISTPDGVTPGNAASDDSTVSGNGRYIAFQSTATNLIAGDGPTQQIYVRDTCLLDTVVTSCTPTTYLVSTTDGTTPGSGLSEHPSMSSSGQYIAFASLATNLSPNTANGVENIFARNTCLSVVTSTTITCTTSTVLVSQPAGLQPPPSNGNSLLPVIGAQGHVAAFFSFSSNLVANDQNGANGIGDIFLGTTTF